VNGSLTAAVESVARSAVIASGGDQLHQALEPIETAAALDVAGELAAAERYALAGGLR
jgi:hypothetical protein